MLLLNILRCRLTLLVKLIFIARQHKSLTLDDIELL